VPIKTTKNLSEIISLGLVNALQAVWRQTIRKSLLVLQRIPKYPGKSVSTITLRIRISPKQEKYALNSVFQNLRISSYQWKRKAEFDKFFSVFANISVSGNGVLVLFDKNPLPLFNLRKCTKAKTNVVHS